MFIEFQINAQTFLDAQLLGIQTMKIDFSQPVSFGNDTYVIDHLSFGANRINLTTSQGVPNNLPVYYDSNSPQDFQTVSQQVYELIQPVTVYIVNMNDVMAHPNGSPAFVFTIDVEVHYTIRYALEPLTGDKLSGAVAADTATSVDNVSIEYYYTKFISVNPILPGLDTGTIGVWASTYMAGLIKPIVFPLGLVSQMFPGKNQPLPLNTGMAIDPDRSRISFRQEAGGGAPGDPVSWQQYFNGIFPDRMQGKQWALFIDAASIQDVMSDGIYRSLMKNNAQFALVSGVASKYVNNAGIPNVTSVFSGNIDTPICTVFTDVQLASVMSAGAPNTLVSIGTLSWNTHGGACEVTAALLGAAIGLGVDLVLPFLAGVINPVTGAIAGIAGVLYIEATKQPDLPPMDTCVAETSTLLKCTKVLPPFVTPLGNFSFSSLAGFDEGFSMQGQLLAIPPGTAQAIFTTSDILHWDAPTVPCGQLGPSTIQEMTAHPKDYALLSATITITTSGLVPVYIFSVTPVNDNLKLLTSHFVQDNTQTPATVTIEIPYPGDTYYASPYPLEFLIATSGGIRLISLGEIPPLTQGDIDGMIAGIAAQIDRCNEKVVNQFGYFRKYVLHWSVDPYQGQKVFHLYEIGLRGLKSGERVAVRETSGKLLQTAMGRSGQPVMLDALMDPLSYKSLELVPEKPEVQHQTKETFSGSGLILLDVTGQLIITHTQLRVPQNTAQVFATYYNSRPTIVLRTDAQVFGYDMSNPSIPVLIFVANTGALKGLMSIRGNLLGFGDEGFTSITGNNFKTTCCPLPSIHAGIFYGGLVYALSEKGLDVYNSEFRKLYSIENNNNDADHLNGNMVVSRGSLFIAGKNQVRQYSLSDPQKPRLVKSHSMPDIMQILVPPVSQGNSLLLRTSHGRVTLYDFSKEHAPVATVEFAVEPWWVNTIPFNQTLLNWDKRAGRLSINYYGKKKLL
jgi:hypothetical protein